MGNDLSLHWLLGVTVRFAELRPLIRCPQLRLINATSHKPDSVAFCPVLLSRRLKYESILALLDFKTEQNQGCQVEEFHGDKVFLREAVALKQYFVYCKKRTQCGGKD
mgnify:FL=1